MRHSPATLPLRRAEVARHIPQQSQPAYPSSSVRTCSMSPCTPSISAPSPSTSCDNCSLCSAGPARSRATVAVTRKVGHPVAGLALQSRHFSTPRMVHTRQTNVPQLSHGYPSEARSSRPHARQSIASRSAKWWPRIACGPSARDRVSLDLGDQRCTGDAELARGVGAIAAMVLERAIDMHPFEFLERQQRCVGDPGVGVKRVRHKPASAQCR